MAFEKLTMDEMRDYLEGVGYFVEDMSFVEIDELAEAEGFKWNEVTNKFHSQN